MSERMDKKSDFWAIRGWRVLAKDISTRHVLEAVVAGGGGGGTEWLAVPLPLLPFARARVRPTVASTASGRWGGVSARPPTGCHGMDTGGRPPSRGEGCWEPHPSLLVVVVVGRLWGDVSEHRLAGGPPTQTARRPQMERRRGGRGGVLGQPTQPQAAAVAPRSGLGGDLSSAGPTRAHTNHPPSESTYMSELIVGVHCCGAQLWTATTADVHNVVCPDRLIEVIRAVN